MGFEDFDQMDTWDAGKTAGGRHGSMPSKKRMKNLTDKVNGKKYPTTVAGAKRELRKNMNEEINLKRLKRFKFIKALQDYT